MAERRWKFTFKDLFILTMIVVVLLLFIQKIGVARDLDYPDTTFEIVLRGELQPSFMVDQIKVGDKVYQKGSPVVIGEVIDVKTEPAEAVALNLYSGEQKLAVQPDQYTITVTMRAYGSASVNGSAILDNNLITLNQYLVINTDRVYLPTRVVSIEDKG